MQLILVLLVVYALVLMPIMSVVMMFLVRRAAQSRLRLFSIFISLPRPTIMALASKSISVTGVSHFDLKRSAWCRCVSMLSLHCLLPCLR